MTGPMLRIVYYNRLLNEPWGCGVHGRALVRAWRGLGHEVLCLPDDLEEANHPTPASRIGRFSWLPWIVRSLGLDVRGRLWVLRSAQTLRKAIESFDPDVVVARRAAHDYVLDRLMRETSVFRIAEVNAILHWELDAQEGKRVLPWEARSEVSYFRTADRLVAVSSAVAEQLERLGIDGSALRVVPNGTDPDVFHPGALKDPAVSEWASTRSAVLAFCGTLAGHQDFETLCRAVDVLAEDASLGFLFIGPDDQQVAQHLRLAPRQLMCTGRVPHARVPAILACADIGWAAHANDRVSALKVYEYLAMGLPVVLADQRQGRELLATAGCGLSVDRGDSAELAAKVGSLLADRQRARAMGAAGRQWIEQNASWKHVAQQMLLESR